MTDFLANYWPHLVFALSLLVGISVAIHAVMTKDDVRAAAGWAGVILLSPLLGAFIYLVAGINRIRQQKTIRKYAGASLRRAQARGSSVDVTLASAGQFASLKTLVDHISVFPLTAGNHIEPLNGGDETYPAMLAAIHGASKTIALQSYIFDNDPIGQQVVEALAQAKARGVQVRVLIDGVGVRYSRPPVSRLLHAKGIRHALFNDSLLGLRLAYADLRSHRKVMVVDGVLGLTGGMNIRAGFTHEFGGANVTQDKHFRVHGPVVSQLLSCFIHDWRVTTGEALAEHVWFADHAAKADAHQGAGVPARIVPSGPDQNLANTHSVIMGAITVAQKHIRICSPYFLPDQQLIGVLAVAARRGVRVDIVIPSCNNLKLVDYAMTAQLDQVIRPGCRVWRASGTFDHSKLLTVDGAWSYVGSSNIDPRSLRLNFELDIEIYDRHTAAQIEAMIDRHVHSGTPETLQTLRERPFLTRLRNRIVWLASPYL